MSLRFILHHLPDVHIFMIPMRIIRIILSFFESLRVLVRQYARQIIYTILFHLISNKPIRWVYCSHLID